MVITKHDIQIQREIEQANMGRLAFEKMLQDGVDKQREATSIYGVKLLKEVYASLKPQILYFFETQASVKRKSPLYQQIIAPALETYDEDEVANIVAFMFAQIVLNKFSGYNYLTNVATNLIKHLINSLNVEVKDKHNLRLIASSLQLVRHLVDSIDWLSLQQEPRIKNEDNTWVGGRVFIIVAKEKREEVESFIEALIPHQVNHKPMITKPLPHHNLLNPRGGYLRHSSPLLKHPVKVNGKVHPWLVEFNVRNNPEFFKLLNEHQEVGYQINRKVLEALPILEESGIYVEGLDSNLKLIRAKEYNDAEDELKELENGLQEQFGDKSFGVSDMKRKEVFIKHECKAKQAVHAYERTISLAKELQDEEELYFPIYLDNRCRFYYYGRSINPQGNVLQKALLQFTESVVVGEEEYNDLLIALGTCMGYDKKVLSVRKEKALEIIPTIRKGDVVEIIKQMDEEEGLVGLAIALEIKAYLEAKDRGEEYRTHQPIHSDSCNSANQLTGLLLCDYRNAKLTNIINVVGDTLEDTYRVVAEDLKEYMTNNNSTGVYNTMLEHDDIFTRKVFKKSTMTRSAYGASFRTCDKDIRTHLRDEHREFWDASSEADKKILVKKAVETIDRCLPASAAYKQFGRKMIRLAVKRDGALAYHNPCSGFPVVLRENKKEIEQVNYRELYTHKNKKFNIVSYTKELNVNATVSSSVPSIIHSFDAAVIVRTRQLTGNIPMTTIHDSIGVLPGMVYTKLIPAIRQTYYEICSERHLQQIIDELGLTGDVEIPFSDDLNPKDILESLHLYS